MPGLPSNVLFGTVTATIIYGAIDSVVDLDSEPEGLPVTGKIIFRPSINSMIDVSNKVIVLPASIQVTLSNGKISDSEGNEFVKLIATDCPGLTPSSFTWLVEFNLKGFKIPSFNILVPHDTIVDLSTTLPVSFSSGIVYLLPENLASLYMTQLEASTLIDTIATASATSVVASEAALSRNADNLLSGTVAEARIPNTIARDTEVATAITNEINARNPAISVALAALVNSAPGVLDTLNEIAIALGNDANFAASMMTLLAGKQPIGANLTAIQALTSAANKFPYATGLDTWTLGDITTAGQAPTADAGQDLTGVECGQTVILDGSASLDSDGATVTYSWAVPNCTVANTATAFPSVTVPWSLTSQTYTATLTVTDVGGLTDTDTATISVEPATESMFVAGVRKPIRLVMGTT